MCVYRAYFIHRVRPTVETTQQQNKRGKCNEEMPTTKTACQLVETLYRGMVKMYELFIMSNAIYDRLNS